MLLLDRLPRLFRRTRPDTDTPTALLELPYPAKHSSRDDGAPRVLSPRQAARAARHAVEVAEALPTPAQRDRLAEAVARHLDPDAPTRLMPWAEVRDSIEGGEPRELVRPYAAKPAELDEEATA
jgi:hypothetical protein